MDKPRFISPINVLLMTVLVLFWGSSFVIVKKLELDELLTPISIATFRFLVAGALFALALLYRRGKQINQDRTFQLRNALDLVLLALTGVTFFFIVQYTGIELAGASVSAILVCLLSPVLIAGFSVKLFGEHLSISQILGIGIAGGGALAVIVGGTLNLGSPDTFLTGSLLLLLTPLLWAAYSLLGKRMMQSHDAFALVAGSNILGGLFLVPISMAEGTLGLMLSMSVYAWFGILFLAVTCSFIGYYIWFHVLQQTGAATASSFLFAEPIVTIIFASIFSGENLSITTAIGTALIFLGVYLVAKKRSG